MSQNNMESLPFLPRPRTPWNPMPSKAGCDLLSPWISNSPHLSWFPTMVLSSVPAHRLPDGEIMKKALIGSSQHTFTHGRKDKVLSWVMITTKTFTTCMRSSFTQQFLVDGSSSTQPITLIPIRPISLSRIIILQNGLKFGIRTP